MGRSMLDIGPPVARPAPGPDADAQLPAYSTVGAPPPAIDQPSSASASASLAAPPAAERPSSSHSSRPSSQAGVIVDEAAMQAALAASAHTRDDNGPLGPATFYLAGRFIHATHLATPPVYELSHVLANLCDASETVELQRLDYQVKTSPEGVAQVTTRTRDLFHLRHPRPLTYPRFPYHAEPARRSALGAVGLLPVRPSGWRLGRIKEFRVMRAARGADHRMEERELLFGTVAVKDSAVGHEWRDEQGRLVAREVDEGGALGLVVTAEMSAVVRDALIAAWVLRVWHDIAKGVYAKRKWNEGNGLLTGKKWDFSIYSRGGAWSSIGGIGGIGGMSSGA